MGDGADDAYARAEDEILEMRDMSSDEREYFYGRSKLRNRQGHAIGCNCLFCQVRYND